MDEGVLILNPVGGAVEDGHSFFLADLHAVEGDIIDDDAVRQAMHVEVDEAFVALADGANPGLHGLAWSRG